MTSQPVNENDIRSHARSIASSNYHPDHFAYQEVSLFVAKERDEFEIDAKDLGWSSIIPKLKIYSVPGDHLGILKKGNVEILADIISRHLK